MSRTGVVRALVAGIVLLALVAGGWWVTHPPQPEGGGYNVGARRDVGEVSWMPLLDGDTDGPSELRITGIEPTWRKDAAATSLDYRICVLDPSIVGGFIIAGKDGPLETYCSSTRPAIGSTFHLRTDPREVLVVGVTPTRVGTSDAVEHRIDYRVGWQRGHMVLDVGTKVRTTTG